MDNWITRQVERSLGTPVTPLAYLVVANSMFFGLATIIFQEAESVKMTVIQKIGIWDGFPVWGWWMVVSSIFMFIGMMGRSVIRTKIGAVMGFLGWIFVFVAYLEFQYWFQMGLSLMSALSYGYFYLAVNINRLWDYTPD